MMDLAQISNIVTITLGVITILGLIFSYIKKDSIKNNILSWLDKPVNENGPLTNDLTYCDVTYGCKLLKEKLEGPESSGYYIICLSRGGAILGGMLSKLFDTRRIRHLYIDEDGVVNCEWDISELKNEHVLLVDDCIRFGSTMNKAHKKILELCEKKGFDVDLQVVTLLCFVHKKEKNILSKPMKKNETEIITMKRNVISAFKTENSNLKLPWDKSW